MSQLGTNCLTTLANLLVRPILRNHLQALPLPHEGTATRMDHEETDMNKFLTGLCATTLAASFALPVSAAPLFVPKAPESARPDVQNVQLTIQLGESRRDWRRDGRRWRNDDRHYYRGYRGHREYRHGYKRHSDGWWYPAAAFVAGAIITGAIANNNRSSGSAHVDWCYDRYRSYRASDNTFQPYSGPRQRCYSPYS
jgi:hypothetical protein